MKMNGNTGKTTINNNNNFTQIFTDIYEQCLWGNNNNNKYKGSSGHGSSIEYNIEYIKWINIFLSQYNISSVVDLGCGDWRVGEKIFANQTIRYTGYDVYEKLIDYLNNKYSNQYIQFILKDVTIDYTNVLSADLLIIKDVMQHWDDDTVELMLSSIFRSSKFKYILITNCTSSINNVLEQPSFMHRGLDCNHRLLSPYNLLPVFKYQSKETMLYITKNHNDTSAY